MQTQPLGNSGIRIPEIGFGTWNYSAGVEPLRALIDRGPCFIDTAEIYGTESVVGQAIRGSRDRVFLATKVRPANFRRADLIAAAERSLRSLGVERIDLYQLHWPNAAVSLSETMHAMAELVDSGKVRFVGLSNFSAGLFRKAQAALPRHGIVSDQVRYGLTDRTIERELLPWCLRHAVTVLAFSPLGSSLASVRAADPGGVLPRVASMVGKTEGQVALNWVLCKGNVIPITRASSVARVLENCDASGWRLPPEAVAMLDSGIRCHSRGPAESALRHLTRSALQFLGKQQ